MMGWNPSGGGGGSGTIKKIASKNTTRLSVTHPTGPTVTLTPKVAPGVGVGGAFRSTTWYGVLAAAAAMVMTKNKLYFVPFVIGQKFTSKKIVTNVFTGGASTTVRLGIYKDNGHGKPGAKVLDCGTITSATTGPKTLAAVASMTPGTYWLAGVSQGSGTGAALSHMTATPSAQIRIALMQGATTALGTSTVFGWASTASTFSGALPTPAPAVNAQTSVTTVPAIQLQSA